MNVHYQYFIPNHFSSREGARIHGLVLHTTQGDDDLAGDRDLETLKHIFEDEPDSAHYGTNRNGRIAQFVHDSDKAWAVCNYNPVTLNWEQVGFAEFSENEWFKRHEQLKATATFLVYGHIQYGVPLAPGKCQGSSIIQPGIFQHKDFGISGSGHTDCGPGYPQGYVTLLAQYYIAKQLHSKAPHTLRLKKKVNDIRKVHDLALLP